jgi:hypothetical protein
MRSCQDLFYEKTITAASIRFSSPQLPVIHRAQFWLNRLEPATSIRKRSGSILFRTVKNKPAEKSRNLNSRPTSPDWIA